MSPRWLTVIALLLSLALSQQPSESKPSLLHPVYTLIGPEVAGQNESFTGVVVEETDHGMVPVSQGSQVNFNGKVVDVKENGKVEVPALMTLGTNVLVPTLVGMPGQKKPITLSEFSVKVLQVPSNLAPRIYHADEIFSLGQPFRVQGQVLNSVNSGYLVNGDSKIPITNAVGSSLERVFPLLDKPTVPNGSYRFVAQDESGKDKSAPNQSTVPNLKLEGAPVKKKNTVGEITVTCDTDAQVQIGGGEPEITLSRHLIFVHANIPAHVPYVAKKVGEYQVYAFAFGENKHDSSDRVQRELAAPNNSVSTPDANK